MASSTELGKNQRDQVDGPVDPLEKSAVARELEFILKSPFFRTTRRSKEFLAHVVNYKLEGHQEPLKERMIGAELFHRPAGYATGDDAVVRVQAGEVRRRLEQYYHATPEGSGVRIHLPVGSYTPEFIWAQKTPPIQEPPETAKPEHPEQERNIAPFVSPLSRRPIWAYVLLAAGLIVLAAPAFYLVSRVRRSAASATAAHSSVAAASARPIPSSALASVPLRLLAGYTGEPQTDSAGYVWQADRYVHGGGPWRRPDAFIGRTSDPLLFQQWRTGDFAYDIPLQPGVYELHLYFVTSDRASNSFSTFSVAINGDIALRGFDVNSDAMGDNVADERVFRDISPGKDGMAHISFASERGAPQLNALEILPGIPHKLLPIRLVTLPTSFTDHNGQSWHPDNYYLNGRLSDQHQQTSGSADPDLFATERFGHFTYALPVDTRDQYTLVLHFAEFYFGPQSPGGGGTGSRVFRVMCNGVMLLDSFDIFREGGSLHAITKTFYHVRPTAQGKLNLTFEPISQNATVSGIEVLDESQ